MKVEAETGAVSYEPANAKGYLKPERARKDSPLKPLDGA